MIQNFLSKLSPTEKKIFYIAIIFVLLALLDRLFLGPAMSRLKSLDEEIEQQKNVIKGDLRFLSYKDKILKENETFKPYYAPKSQAEEEIIAAFLKKFEILASDSKVNLIKINPADSKQRKGFIEYYANLECDGKLDDMAKFIYSINTSDDLLKIVKLSMAPKKAGSEEVTSSMTVTKTIVGVSATQEVEQLSKQAGAGQKETIVTGELKSDKADTSTVEEATDPKAGESKAKADAQADQGGGDETKPSVWEKFMEKKAK